MGIRHYDQHLPLIPKGHDSEGDDKCGEPLSKICNGLSMMKRLPI